MAGSVPVAVAVAGVDLVEGEVVDLVEALVQEVAVVDSAAAVRGVSQ